MAGSDDLKVLSMDMDRDLKDMDLEAERPTQPLGDGDVAKWVTPNSPTPSQTAIYRPWKRSRLSGTPESLRSLEVQVSPRARDFFLVSFDPS